MVIVTGFEHYCGLNSSEYDSIKAAFVSASLLDASTFVARKHGGKSLLLVSCLEDTDNKMEVLTDLYFKHCFSGDNDNVNRIINLF